MVELGILLLLEEGYTYNQCAVVRNKTKVLLDGDCIYIYGGGGYCFIEAPHFILQDRTTAVTGWITCELGNY